MNYRLFQMIHGMAGHNHFLDKIMIFCTKDALYVLALVLLGMWIFTPHKKSALYAGITGIVGLIVNVIISHIYYEPRPFITHHVHLLIPHAADASFPSDHSTGAFAIAFALWIRHRKIGTFVSLFALLTGFSRVYVGHHYPMDVVGSFIVSMLVAWLVYRFHKWIDPVVDFFVSLYEGIVSKIVKKKTLS